MKRYLFLAALAFVFPCNANSQQSDTCKHYPPLPMMFMDQKSSKNTIQKFRNGWFLQQSKHRKLIKTSTAHTQSQFVDTSSILQIITEASPETQLEIHFATKVSRAEKDRPVRETKDLVLLFKVYTKTQNVSKFYTVNPTNGMLLSISTADAKKWISYYNDVTQLALRKTLIKDNPNDRRGSHFYDTQIITYDIEKLKEALIDERLYQLQTHGRNIVGYQLNLAAYKRRGRVPLPSDSDTSRYRKRMFVQFDYLVRSANGNLVSFNLEEDQEFHCRSTNREEKISLLVGKSLQRIKGMDNGHLCPLKCP